MADGEPRTAGELARPPASTRATSTSGFPRRPRAATPSTTRRPTGSTSAAEQAVRARPTRTTRSSSPGGVQVAASTITDVRPDRRRHSAPAAASRWDEHHHDLFDGTDRFFRPGYSATSSTRGSPRSTVSTQARAGRQGGRRRLRPRRVHDPDGRGLPATRRSSASTTTRPSIEAARQAAAEAGVGDRVHLRGGQREGLSRHRATTSSRSSTPSTTWATRSAPPRTSAQSLADDGTWLLVEPFAGDRLAGQPQPGRAASSTPPRP